MSHNVLSVNNNDPSRAGDVDALSLSDVITVVSPTDGQYLAKGATDWETATIPTGDVTPGFSIDTYGYYGVSPYYYEAVDNYIIYSPKIYHEVTNVISTQYASGSYVPVAHSSWFQAIKLARTGLLNKTLIVEATIAPYQTTGAKVVAQWVNGYTGTYTPIGPKVVCQGQSFSDTLWGRFEYTSANSLEYLAIKYISVSGASDSWLAGEYRHMCEQVVLRILD